MTDADGFTTVGALRQARKSGNGRSPGPALPTVTTGWRDDRGIGRSRVSGYDDHSGHGGRGGHGGHGGHVERGGHGERGERGGRGGRGGHGGHDTSAIKKGCKQAVKTACDFKVNSLDAEQVAQIISDACRKCNVSDASARRTVHATVIGMIIKYVPHLKSGMSECIRRLADPIRETMQTSLVGCSEKAVRGATGYDLLNAYCWPGITDVNTDEFLSGLETLLEVCGCDVLAQNAKGETALSSYDNAVARGHAPNIEAVRGILRAGIRRENLIKMVQTLINKFSPANVAKLGNVFKLISIIDLNLLVTKLVENTFGLYAFGKKMGRFEWVSDNIAAYRAMLRAPILNDEWTSTLHAKFKNPDGVFNALVKRLASVSVALMEEKKTFLESKGKNECAAIAIDVIAAFVGEASAIMGDDQYTVFVSKLLDTPESAITQNLILTATAHLLFRLKESNAPKASITNFMTPEIIKKLAYACRVKTIDLRITIHLEACVKTFVGESIMADKFERLLVLFPYKSQAKFVDEDQDIITQTSFAIIKLGEEKDVKEDYTDVKMIEDVSSYVNLVSVDALIPRFLTRVDPAITAKASGTWPDETISDWVEYVLHRKSDEKTIMSLIVTVTSELLSPNTFLPARITLFKNALDEVFKTSEVNDVLEKFIAAKNRNIDPFDPKQDEFRYLWETDAGFGYFEQFIALYGLKY